MWVQDLQQPRKLLLGLVNNCKNRKKRKSQNQNKLHHLSVKKRNRSYRITRVMNIHRQARILEKTV